MCQKVRSAQFSGIFPFILSKCLWKWPKMWKILLFKTAFFGYCIYLVNLLLKENLSMDFSKTWLPKVSNRFLFRVCLIYHIGQQKFVINLKWPSNFLHGLKWPLKIWHFRPISCMSNNSILLEFWRLLRFLLTFCHAKAQFYPNPQKWKGTIFTKLEILSSTKITGTWNFLCDWRTCLGMFHD